MCLRHTIPTEGMLGVAQENYLQARGHTQRKDGLTLLFDPLAIFQVAAVLDFVDFVC